MDWLHRIEKTTHWIRQSLQLDTIEKLDKLASNIAAPYLANTGKNPEAMPLIMTAGNGGSHALAEHLTAELIWRISKEQEIRIPSVCLTSNSSVLTALSNDVGYGEALAYYAGTLYWLSNEKNQPILITFSTSGGSKNILDLIEPLGYDCMVHRVLFAGTQTDEELPADEVFYVRGPGVPTTAIIQEVHQVYIHILCEMISEKLNEAHFNSGRRNPR